MLDYLYSLLPAWVQRLIEPEVDDLIASFGKLERKLLTTAGRHQLAHDALHAVRAEIDSEIADTAAELERAKRIAARVKSLID